MTERVREWVESYNFDQFLLNIYHLFLLFSLKILKTVVTSYGLPVAETGHNGYPFCFSYLNIMHIY